MALANTTLSSACAAADKQIVVASATSLLPGLLFFCNGEIGPVGERNFLHGYTASLALFVKKEAGD